MFARKLHDLDFRVGGGDFELVVEDHFVMAEHVARGEVEAALAIPEAAISYLRKGELEVMYDNKLPLRGLRRDLQLRAPGHDGQQLHGHRRSGTTPTRRRPQAFLDLWEEGIKGWRAKQAEIIKTYPQHFAVEEDEDVNAMQEYLADHDWFVDSVYLDDEWIKNETALYDLMKETEFMEAERADARVRGHQALRSV